MAAAKAKTAQDVTAMMKDMMGGKDAEMMERMQNMSAEELEAETGPLGPNPFADGAPAGGLPGLGGGMGMPSMGSLPTRGATKKKRKPRPKKGKRK